MMAIYLQESLGVATNYGLLPCFCVVSHLDQTMLLQWGLWFAKNCNPCLYHEALALDITRKPRGPLILILFIKSTSCKTRCSVTASWLICHHPERIGQWQSLLAHLEPRFMNSRANVLPSWWQQHPAPHSHNKHHLLENLFKPLAISFGIHDWQSHNCQTRQRYHDNYQKQCVPLSFRMLSKSLTSHLSKTWQTLIIHALHESDVKLTLMGHKTGATSNAEEYQIQPLFEVLLLDLPTPWCLFQTVNWSAHFRRLTAAKRTWIPAQQPITLVQLLPSTMNL